MKRSWATAVMIFIFLANVLFSVRAFGRMRKMGEPELTSQADLIVTGEVKRIESRREPEGPIYTYVTIAVMRSLKGKSAPEVTLRYLGGEVDGKGLWVEDTPEFKLGEKVKVYLEGKDIYTVVGSYQGKYTLTEEGVSIQSTEQCFTLLPYDCAHWPGPNPMPEVYLINPNCQDTQAGNSEEQVNAIRAGARAWNNEGNANFNFTYGGTTNKAYPDTISPNGYNEIMFKYSTQDFCGWAVVHYTGNCPDRHIVECDIQFNDSYLWNGVGDPISGEIDIWSVAAHEFGHMLYLGDISYWMEPPPDLDCSFETMYGAGPVRISERDLNDGDTAGIRYIYGAASNTNPVLTNGHVSPTQGNCQTSFAFYVDYYDADGDSADTANVYIDSVAHSMNLYSGSPSNGTYRYQTTLFPPDNYYFYFTDGNGGSDTEPVLWGYQGPTVTSNICGDVNGDCVMNWTDVNYLSAYLYQGGPPPLNPWTADINCDGQINSLDLNALIYALKYHVIPLCCEE